jgi:pilus assembly protein Flp/PilA
MCGHRRKKAAVIGLLWRLRARVTLGENGASLVEYALLLALIVLVCIAAMTLLGNQASTRFSTTGVSLGAS